ncbi:IS110 family transposase [Aquibacillus halophilus]|uniref:IS110 family transposase n=1 Tax=Aquibacillus halophilus TaxID=930132 RepID=A0A6A8DN38_9BACI|nr:IS110 family transposase [Aquibacillus halophilus]MRH45171.1 IS110 family transposase [Aquibacillus halophilus]
MEAMIERCAGLDVHQKVVVGCVLHGSLDKRPKKEIKSFSTTTEGLLELSDWLFSKEVTDVVMESTGVYWKPIWNILEERFHLILANARHVKNVPGRKTDVKDAEWLAKLLRSGLIEGNFVPPESIRDLRDLTRYRTKLIYNRSNERNRIHKILQDGNIKLTSVLSDIFGTTGRRILEKIMDGEKIELIDLEKLVHRGTKANLFDIASAINGRIRHHHRYMLRQHWDHMMYLENLITEIEKQIDICLEPYRKEVELLDTIPGVDKNGAATLVAEMGIDMSVYKSDKHFASWAGVSPGNNESAGKKKRTKSKKGNKVLKTMAVQCALSTRPQNNRVSSFYKRILKRQGAKKAQMATAHLLLKIAYNILKTGEPYKELGPDYMKQKQENKEIRMIEYLKRKGYEITSTDPEVA